jgi:hypothetical protein
LTIFDSCDIIVIKGDAFMTALENLRKEAEGRVTDLKHSLNSYRDYRKSLIDSRDLEAVDNCISDLECQLHSARRWLNRIVAPGSIVPL